MSLEDANAAQRHEIRVESGGKKKFGSSPVGKNNTGSSKEPKIVRFSAACSAVPYLTGSRASKPLIICRPDAGLTAGSSTAVHPSTAAHAAVEKQIPRIEKKRLKRHG